MLDDVTETATAAVARQGWQDLLRHQLQDCQHQLHRALGAAETDRQLEFRLLKTGARALSLQCSAGDRTGYFKLFHGSQAHTAYMREKLSLMVMARGGGLVPQVLAFSDSRRFLLQTWLAPMVWPLGPDAVRAARRLGIWLAKFDAQAPAGVWRGNWYDYLKKHGEALDLGKVPTALEVLGQIPLCGTALARNDAALHNFLQGPDGELIGCDFENARMKPRGWDYVMTWISLLERYPGQADEVIPAFSDGYASAHRGVLLVEELNAIARILLCARATRGHDPQERWSWR